MCGVIGMLAGCSEIGDQIGTGLIDGGSDLGGDGGGADASSPSDAEPPPDAAPCVEGDAQTTGPDGQCYLFFSLAPLPWADARLGCEALGAHLAIATSTEENAALAALIPVVDGNDVWMGATDVAVEGSWLWVDGASLGYDNWRTGEPNNGAGGEVEHCMILEGENGGLWDDRPCALAYRYLCERD